LTAAIGGNRKSSIANFANADSSVELLAILIDDAADALVVEDIPL
jgi:hypothetical protein